MWLRHHPVSAELNGILTRQRLREMLVQPIHCVMMLSAEERHVREHRERVHRRGSRLGREDVLVPNTQERLLRQR